MPENVAVYVALCVTGTTEGDQPVCMKLSVSVLSFVGTGPEYFSFVQNIHCYRPLELNHLHFSM